MQLAIDQKSDHVAILLATYNGDRYLHAQLSSYLRQIHTNWRVYCSDDGSNDKTHEIYKQFAIEDHQRFAWIDGPCKGYADNFLSMVRSPEIKGDFYAYSDQDDVWVEDKLARAITFLRTAPAEKPAMYCSATILTDEDGADIGLSRKSPRGPSFRNALVENIATGNTIVINNAARDILARFSKPATVWAHDWWTYLVLTGVGGLIQYDPMPTVNYRQHRQNLVGQATSWSNQSHRIGRMLHGDFVKKNAFNIEALSSNAVTLTSENKELLKLFENVRQMDVFSRLRCWHKGKFYRQTIMGNIGLWTAVFLGRI